jgi:tetratricopeptide (TPR) repeat protein
MTTVGRPWIKWTIAATLLTSLFAARHAHAQQGGKIVLPAETKGGDPAPDTNTAANYLRAGRYEEAIRSAKSALQRDERYVPAMIVMAKAYYYQRKYELATSIIDIAKSVDPNNADGYNLLGFIALNRDPENPDRISATAAFKKATELNGSYAAAWNNLAAQYLFSKNYDGAIGAAEQATKLAGNFPKAWLNLGSAYRGKQRYQEADQAYKRALQLDANYVDAYFDLGILYLDAKEFPGMDLVSKLNTSINYLNRYKQLAGYRLTKDDPADTYIAEAKTNIDREQKRIQRQQKQQQRGTPKGPDKTEGK